jgi:polysaccharide pyruvyl transferase CsaB
MKAVLSGYFGFGNIGDEAILEGMIIGLRQKDPSIEITVLSGAPQKTSETYNVASVNRTSFHDVIDSIRRCDILISGGGGLIQDSSGPFSVLYYLGIIYLAKFYGKTAVIVGQGFGPVRRFVNRLLCRWILRKVDMIIVRDERSSDDLIKLGIKAVPIHVAGDVTPVLSKPDDLVSREILRSEGIQLNDVPLIGISIRRPSKKLPKIKADKYYRTIAECSDHMIKKFGARLVFIPFHYPNDIIESSKIINLMANPVNIILREYTPVEILGIISKMDLFIGMRLHSLIFSAMAQIPMVGIAYDPKVKRLMELIKQKYLNMEDIDKDTLIKTVEEAWEKRSENKVLLADWPKHINIKAQLNFEILFSFLGTLMVRDILGVKFDNVDMIEAVSRIEKLVASGEPGLVVTPNPEIVMSCRNDLMLKAIIDNASLRLPDGVGIIWASRFLRRPLKERITGIDLTYEIASMCEQKGCRIFLLGSKPGIAEGAAEYLKTKYPGLNVVGAYHGYFTKEEETKVCANIRSLKPDIVLVGLGSPKQELWMSEHLNKLGPVVCVGVGGSLDVLAGKMKRAPKFVRNLGLEWLYRLLKEPRRWRRQIALIEFVFLVIFTRIFPKRKK